MMQRITKYIFYSILGLVFTQGVFAQDYPSSKETVAPSPSAVIVDDYKYNDDNDDEEVTVVSRKKYVLRRFNADSLTAWKNDPRFKYDEREIQWVSSDDPYTSSEGRKARNSYAENDGVGSGSGSSSSRNSGGGSGGANQGGRKPDNDAKSSPKKEREKRNSTPPPSLDPGFCSVLLWLILIIAGGVLAYVLVKNINNKKNGNSRKSIVRVPIEEEKDIHKIKYLSELELAIAQKNYRLAVRLLYLGNLKLLNDKNIIQWNIAKTNWDYLYEITDSNKQISFKQTTQIFDSVWYGELPLHENTFEQVHNIFKDFKKQLS
jgi:uncharacterized protein (UPF0333 family)